MARSPRKTQKLRSLLCFHKTKIESALRQANKYNRAVSSKQLGTVSKTANELLRLTSNLSYLLPRELQEDVDRSVDRWVEGFKDIVKSDSKYLRELVERVDRHAEAWWNAYQDYVKLTSDRNPPHDWPTKSKEMFTTIHKLRAHHPILLCGDIFPPRSLK